MAAPDLPSAAEYEDKHVHQVYEQIASHFSQTRYKPWPVVDRFLNQLQPGSIGLDVGCGNGKYLTVNKDVFIIASDRSKSLIRIAAQHQPHSAIIADTLHLPHPAHSFDFVISIAVIHHLSTRARRVEAIRELLRLLRPASKDEDSCSSGAAPAATGTATSTATGSASRSSEVGIRSEGGRALIFAWALEQKSSRRGWDRGDDQDVLVPWVFKPQQEPRHKRRQQHQQEHGQQEHEHQQHQQQQQRQHVSHSQPHHAGHTHDLPRHPQLGTPQPALDRDCDYAHQFQRVSNDELHRQQPLHVQLQTQPQQLQGSNTFQRYYHLYVQGELQSEVAEAGGTVVDAGYDRDNWWVISSVESQQGRERTLSGF